jgi:hypothetical protein
MHCIRTRIDPVLNQKKKKKHYKKSVNCPTPVETGYEAQKI